jgi:UDP-N-acetylmuramyl tripeptide synthase
MLAVPAVLVVAFVASVWWLGPGDAVLLASKGHEELQILERRPVPYSHVWAADECLQRRGRA